MISGKKPTIDDVAVLAGVGRTSVSRVLNNGPNVRPQLREKVLQAVKALNFKVNQQARSLALGETKKIGIIHASDFDKEPNSYYSAGIEIGALRACSDLGYALQTHSINQNSPKVFDLISDIILNNSYAGIILTPPFCDDNNILKMAVSNKFPTISISAGLKQNNLVPNIGIDEEKAGYEITLNLINKGHKKFGYIQGIEKHLSAEQRYFGFLRAIKDTNLSEAEMLIKRGNFTFKSGIELAQKILESDNRPSALICANDDMAAGALFSAHKLGLKVPEDISIVGFDDTPVSEIIWPPLTTVHQPLKEFGYAAVKTLVEIIEKRVPLDTCESQLIDFIIVERESAAQFG